MQCQFQIWHYSFDQTCHRLLTFFEIHQRIGATFSEVLSFVAWIVRCRCTSTLPYVWSMFDRWPTRINKSCRDAKRPVFFFVLRFYFTRWVRELVAQWMLHHFLLPMFSVCPRVHIGHAQFSARRPYTPCIPYCPICWILPPCFVNRAGLFDMSSR